MPSKRKFYRTVIQVEILSEEPYCGESLTDIDDDITDGDCSGRIVDVVRNEEHDGAAMATLLQAQGSDPDFFRLLPTGEDEPEERPNFRQLHDERLAARLKARDELAGPFQLLFGVPLHRFWHNIAGLDVIKFDDEVIKSRVDESPKEAVIRQWGQPGMDIIAALMGTTTEKLNS